MAEHITETRGARPEGRITFRWPTGCDEYLSPVALAALEGRPTRVMLEDDELWEAVVVGAYRVADGPYECVLVQIKLLSQVADE